MLQQKGWLTLKCNPQPQMLLSIHIMKIKDEKKFKQKLLKFIIYTNKFNYVRKKLNLILIN